MEKIASVYAALITFRPMQTIYKATDLYFSYDNEFEEFSILTEARPVFSEDADHVVGFIVRNLLKITPMASEEVLTFRISEQELETIKRQAERALKKTKALRDRLSKMENTRVSVYKGGYGND